MYSNIFRSQNIVFEHTIFVFSVEACTELDDTALDLADYAVRSLSHLVMDMQHQSSSCDDDDPEGGNPDSLTATDLSR